MRNSRRLTSAALLSAVVLTACSSGGSSAKKDTPIEDDPKTLVAAGLEAVAEGNDQAALSAFQFAVVKDPGNFLAQYNVGALLQKQGDNVGALESYKSALAAKADYVPALYNEATIFGLTNPALAVATYTKVIALQPIAPTAYLNLGLLEAAMNKDAAARKHFEIAVMQDGTLVKAIPKDVFTRKTAVTPAPRPSSSRTP